MALPDILPYRLSLDASVEPFRSEVEYACAFLDRAHYLERRREADMVLHYGPRPPTGAVVVPAILFPRGVLLDDAGIRLNRELFTMMMPDKASTGFLPTSKGQVVSELLDYDALGLIFFLLSRIEEREAQTTDNFGRFRYKDALATRLNRHAEPLADEAARDLACCLWRRKEVANRSNYALRLTHDVDRLRHYHRPFEPVRNAAGDIVKRRQPLAALRRLRNAYLRGEPWCSFREIMLLSEAVGQASHFYFMGPTLHPKDSPYAMRMNNLLKRLMDEIQRRGHAIGFHAGYETSENAEEWRRQRDGLETIVGSRVRDGRQHVLQYSALNTPDIWDDAGMQREETLSFPEATGFRSGTCRNYQAYSLKRRQILPLEQCATAVADFGLFGGKYRDLSIDDALAECRPAYEACRKYGGDFVVLYHTGIQSSRSREFYARLIEEIV